MDAIIVKRFIDLAATGIEVRVEPSEKFPMSEIRISLRRKGKYHVASENVGIYIARHSTEFFKSLVRLETVLNAMDKQPDSGLLKYNS